jgi:hypothetical protein
MSLKFSRMLVKNQSNRKSSSYLAAKFNLLSQYTNETENYTYYVTINIFMNR